MFTTERFTSTQAEWDKIKEVITFLEHDAFGENAFPAEELAEDFLNEKNFIFLLKSENDEVIGFMYAKTIEDAEPTRAGEKGETAYLWNIIINKKYRGEGLARVLFGRMEEELKGLGYKYMELDALVANNFADNITKNYKDRILKTEEHDSKWGPQVYFRIKL